MGALLVVMLATAMMLVFSMAAIDASRSAPYRQSFCVTWRFNVDVNNLRDWKTVPKSCESYVGSYMNRGDFSQDASLAMMEGVSFAHSVFNSSTTAGTDAFSYNAWVFDIDDTSLSNLPYYAKHSFGAEAYNDTLFSAWTAKAICPPIHATLDLFNSLKDLGFSIFFLTGRSESERNSTATNLLGAGYSGWQGLILRQSEDEGVRATLYKSAKRKSLEDLGYSIVGNVGDQWSDITGYSVGSRTFKVPNPMYYIA
ncbi:hypothetical protein KP509_08G006100 [Ceratopteris richardii]|uniref:Acid phosphatase n=1 Tax=Ceratopteris richardii TaxID=49495 RepID=A0A8T2UAJ7_CERRI|nr:hypothetical protein KP509_08G006100 [Ceratopteris richardii]